MRIRFHKRWPSASRAGSRTRPAWALVLAACGTLAGCASAPGVLFERADREIVWPPPPDRARIAYVGALATDDDLKPSKSLGQRIGETLFGREEARGMAGPAGVCVAGAGETGRVFVADPGLPGVHVFDLETRAYEVWAPPEGEAPFRLPIALALDASGRLLVTDSERAAVLAFDAAGAYLGPIAEGVLERPVGIAVDRSGRILVVDTGRHEVVVLTPEGSEMTRFGGRGSEPGRFNFPTQIAVDDAGRVYVSDSLNFRIQVFDTEFSFVRSVGRQGDLPGYFSQPKGVAVGPRGILHVVDANFEAVQLFDAEGRLLMTFGREGHGPGEFWLPSGMCVDEGGWVWVADTYNRRVQAFRSLDDEVQP